MQITNSVVCGTSKGCIYKQIKPPLMGEHAFPLTGFVCKEAHVTEFKKEMIYYLLFITMMPNRHFFLFFMQTCLHLKLRMCSQECC